MKCTETQNLVSLKVLGRVATPTLYRSTESELLGMKRDPLRDEGGVIRSCVRICVSQGHAEGPGQTAGEHGPCAREAADKSQALPC